MSGTAPGRNVKFCIPTILQTKATILCLLYYQTHNHLTLTVYCQPFFFYACSLFCTFLFLKDCWNTKPNTPYHYNFLDFYTTTTNDFSHLCVITFSNKFISILFICLTQRCPVLRTARMLNFAFHNSPDEGDSSVSVSYQTQNHLTLTVYCQPFFFYACSCHYSVICSCF